MRTKLTAILLILCGATSVRADDPPAKPAIGKNELLYFWRIRDEALKNVRIPFHALTKSPIRDSITSSWDGIWSKVGSRVAVQWTQSDAGNGGKLVPTIFSQAVWDGLRMEQYEKYLLNGKRVREKSRHYSGSFTAWMPFSFGLGPPSGDVSGWPGLLNLFQCRVLGEETIEGRPCLKTLWYFEFEGKPRSPMMLWIDVGRSFLVCRYITLDPAGDHKAAGEIGVLDARFTPSSEYLMQDAAKVGDFWMPTRGRYRSLDKPGLDDVLITMDAAKTQFNQPSVEADFTFTDEAGTVIEDNVRDMNLYVWGEKGTLTGEETVAEDLLRETAAADHLRPARHPGTPQPLLKASCGPGALYFWLRLHGIEASLVDILDNVHEDKGVNIQELADAASKAGRAMAVVRVNDKTSGCPDGNFIAHLSAPHAGHKDAHAEQQGHFVVARRIGREVRLISIPGAPMSLSDYDFFQIWSGYALVPAENVPDPAMLGRARLKKLAYLGSGIIALGVGLGLVIRRSLRERRGTPGAAVTTLLLLGWLVAPSTGCSRSDPKSDNPLRVMGSSTFEFAPTPEGRSVEGSFRLRNDGTEPLSLSLLKSCGCTKATLSRDTLAPGEEQDVKFFINTEGRGGGFNQYVDVLGRGRKLQTLWIVGKVIPGLQLVVEPHLLNFGAMKVGDEVRRDLVFEAITSGEKVPVELQLLDPPANSPLTWVMDWDASEPRTETDVRFNLRRFIKGTVRIKAVRAGRLEPPFLRFANAGEPVKRRAGALVSLEADVYEGFASSPAVLFLGDLGASENQERSIIVRPLTKLSGSPTVTCSSSLLFPKGVVAVDGGFRVDLGIAPQGTPGLIRESVSVRWGDGAVLDVPVAGLRRSNR